MNTKFFVLSALWLMSFVVLIILFVKLTKIFKEPATLGAARFFITIALIIWIAIYGFYSGTAISGAQDVPGAISSMNCAEQSSA